VRLLGTESVLGPPSSVSGLKLINRPNLNTTTKPVNHSNSQFTIGAIATVGFGLPPKAGPRNHLNLTGIPSRAWIFLSQIRG